MAAAGYMGSFMARANYITIKWVQQMQYCSRPEVVSVTYVVLIVIQVHLFADLYSRWALLHTDACANAVLLTHLLTYYLMELCRPVSSSSGRQCLRSASRGDLIVPRFRLRRSGYRAFAVSGPHVWNSLPTEIRQSCNNLFQFKSKLKTFLFQQSWALLWIHI